MEVDWIGQEVSVQLISPKVGSPVVGGMMILQCDAVGSNFHIK